MLSSDILIHSDELYHYGVLGMKWGVRHDKPTGGFRKSKSSTESSEKKVRLSDKQKKLSKIGAAVVGTALVAYGAYKLGAFERFKKPGVARVKGLLESSNPDMKRSVSDLLKQVNPSGSKTNCRACSIASSLRLKGIDAQALDIKGGSFSDVIKGSFKGANVIEMYNPNKDSVTNHILKKFGEGSHGAISGQFAMPNERYDHAFNWIVKDGKVNFFDGQKSLEDCSRYLDFLSSDKSLEMARLDNLEIDPEGIRKFVKFRR